MIEPITLDFETHAIVGNPIVHPPRPVGLAVWVPGQEPAYLAWGHPSGNNCSWYDANKYLRTIIRETNHPLLFHNAGFDAAVAGEEFLDGVDNFPVRKWERIHDTMYLLFLADPYSSTLALKPSADRYLGMAAVEQDELYAWILSNIPEATKKTAGAFISRAPAELVSRYAIGDVIRTRNLFDLLHAKIIQEGMEEAYDRERRLFPITFDGTRRGIRINRDLLSRDSEQYTEALGKSSDMLSSILGISSSDIDSDEVLADGLERAGAVTEWTLTKTGKRSMSKDNLRIVNPEVKTLLDYRSGISTCLQTFMRPWLEFSKEDGRLHPNWNQVKQSYDQFSNKKKGTQTGRLSSDHPNFQNVPSEFTDAKGNPLPVPDGLLPYPVMRRYCLPEEGHVWLKRDFSSQEIRILAHFEDGQLCEAYRANPDLDPHQMARELINSMVGVMYARKDIKITGFSIVYGTGANGLSLQLGRLYQEAYEIKEAYLSAMPGIRELMRDVQRRGKSGQPIRTWGGRIYYVEPSREIAGQVRDFAYKLLNYLIQGSAADQTKESLIDWNGKKEESQIFLATVHDEINISAPKEEAGSAMAFLKQAMNADRFDVPMLSEGFMGENWADLEEVE